MQRQRSSGVLAPAATPGQGPATVIDLGAALDLLAVAVRPSGRGCVTRPLRVRRPGPAGCRYADGGAPSGVVGHVFAEAGVDISALEALGDAAVDDLYGAGRLPCRITLGALAVLRAAQRSQDRGCRWDEVLDQALHAALKVLELVPDSAQVRAGGFSA